MTGSTRAVLVEVVMPPFESVEVTGTKTATGVVGRAVAGAGAGEGVITMLDIDTGGFMTAGSNSLADSRITGPKKT